MEVTWDALMEHLLRSPGHTSVDLRDGVFRAAGGEDGGVEPAELGPFVDHVANGSYRITDGEVRELARSRSEDELLEVLIVAAAGAASARRAATLAAWHGRR
jgi:hypothetical protein